MRKFKNLLSVACLFIISITGYSQGPVYESAYTIAGAQNDFTDFLETDASGNTYVAGRFGAGCDFDPGPAVATMPLTNGLADLFIAKYSASGVLAWKYSSGATFEFIRTFKIDPAGNVYLVGDYSG